MPSHDGLICQGWNWTLADIKAEGKETDVGAMYITDDGKTRLYIKIAAEGRMTVPLCFRQSVANGVEVDWGDGSDIETFSGSGSTNVLPTHKYSASGEYVITLNPLNNCNLTLGADSWTKELIGDSNYNTRIYQSMLYKIEIGKNIKSIGGYVFRYCYGLKSITIPEAVLGIGNYAFECCYSLMNVTIPNTATSIGWYAFNSCSSLMRISISKNVTSVGNDAFSDCKNLTRIKIIKRVTNIGSSTFKNCRRLTNIKIPEGVTSIGYSAFNDCECLTSIAIPEGVVNIDSNTFAYCYGMKFYNFSNHTTIPTMSLKSAFDSIPSDCKIIVPDSLYDDWIVATNWSTYASYIIKKSDWEANQV